MFKERDGRRWNEMKNIVPKLINHDIPPVPILHHYTIDCARFANIVGANILRIPGPARLSIATGCNCQRLNVGKYFD